MSAAASASASSASSPAAASVEVKCLDTFAYYPAYLRDYDNQSQVLVSYPNAWKKDEWVQIENVRNAPPPFDPTTFAPVAGDIVEAQAKSSDDEPYSWWKATIKTVRGEFYMISYSSWEDEFNEILEKDMLRPHNKNPPLKQSDIKKLELALPKDLRDSGALDVRALNSVLETSGALSVHVDHKKSVLVILGNTVSVKRAQLLAGMAFKHLGEIQRLTERKQKHQTHLEQLKQRLNEDHLETFPIQPPELIGLVIGVAGKNIKRVEKMPGILNVRVDSSKSQVSILAKSEEEAKAAREQLEFIEQRFPVLKRHAGRVVGKSFSNMDSIQKDSGVVRIKLDVNKPSDDPAATVDLILIGTKETVADALLLLNHHLEFLNTVNQLSQDERELSDEVRKMNIESGVYEGSSRGGYSRGGFSGRGARGPRQHGNREYSVKSQSADFPPLSASASSSSQQHSKPKQQQQAAASSSSARGGNDDSEYQRGGRGGGRGGRVRPQSIRGTQQLDEKSTPAPAPVQAEQKPQQQQRQQKKQQPAATTADAPVGSPTSGESSTRGGRGGGRGGRGGQQRERPAATEQKSAESSTPAATTAQKPQSAKRQNQKWTPVDATATPSDAAASAPSTSPDAASKPKKENNNKRNERRPRQPTGDASASPSAPADGASSSPVAPAAESAPAATASE